MNLRSMRTAILSGLMVAIYGPSVALAQEGPAVETITGVSTDAAEYSLDSTIQVTVNVNHSAGNDDWYRTGIQIRQADGATVVDTFCSEQPTPDIVNSGGAKQAVIDYDATGIPSGDYRVYAHGFKVSNSICDPSNNSNGFPEGWVESNPSGVTILTVANFTVNKEWIPGRAAALVDIQYSCSDGTNGSGQASTNVPFQFQVEYNAGEENPNPPTCSITETPVFGYDDITGAACTDVPLVPGGDASCTLTNDVIPVPFFVSKTFSDGNDQAEVTVNLECTNPAAVIATVKGTASAGSPAEFTVDGIRADGSTQCTATESNIPDGYSADEGVCSGNLVLVDGGSCALTNNQDPVEIYVDKIYSETHPIADPEVDITLVCANADVAAGGIHGGGDMDAPVGVVNMATATTVNGRATFTVSNYLFYGSGCYATEEVPAGYVQDLNDDTCGDESEPGILVLPGGIQYDPPGLDEPKGDGAPPNCTITNDPTVATFSIEKDFSDDNPMAVGVTATCADDGAGPGLVLNGASGTTAMGSASEAAPFAVEIKYADGSASCDGAEDNDLPGYTTEAGDGPAADCGADQTVAVDSSDVACEIFNDQDPIEIQAAKVYSSGGAGAVDFAVECTNLDTGGSVTPSTDSAAPGSPAIFTVNDVMWDGSTLCSVSEPVPPGGYYESDNTCTTDNLDMTPDSDDPRTCEITNTPTRATFKVTKNFADGNNVDEIEVAIDCNTGLILDQDKDLGDGDMVTFVVTSFTEGSLVCTITEDGQAGYSGEYENLTITGAPVVSDESCFYAAEEIVGDSEHECVITNTPDPVLVSIYKDWVFSGNNEPDIDTYIEIAVGCTSEIVYELTECGTLGPASDSPPEGGSGFFFLPYEFEEFCSGTTGLNDFGMDVWVVPAFPTTECEVVEYVYDQAIETENGCGTFNISVGNGKECVITNTVFFEGIPTLSQYGMVLLALLMLGVGFVSFRRFA